MTDFKRNEPRYVPGDDGLLVERVGNWVIDKHKILADYVQAAGAARRKFLRNSPAFIDVFSGPGRSQIRDTDRFVDGSSIVTFKQGNKSVAAFSSIEISDGDDDLLKACETRLERLDAPANATQGPATVAMKSIVAKLNPYGLHFAFLDPHNLGALSFSLFESMAPLRHIDVLVHVSLQDLRRNVDRYSSEAHEEFDVFAPGWRTEIDIDQHTKPLRAAIIKYWSSKVEALGLPRAEHCEIIIGDQGQHLYWLMLLSKSDFAHKLWHEITSAYKQPKFSFVD
ncbi:MAG TPA: three-Cys-motif partner protein TcmP [Pyrinomonadaceae bacterium]|jgi:three-Cys-motif partner protein|nr:three-Cys-motif partner protein TcmP [Pyrinomonadaceae bacterium]